MKIGDRTEIKQTIFNRSIGQNDKKTGLGFPTEKKET